MFPDGSAKASFQLHTGQSDAIYSQGWFHRQKIATTPCATCPLFLLQAGPHAHMSKPLTSYTNSHVHKPHLRKNKNSHQHFLHYRGEQLNAVKKGETWIGGGRGGGQTSVVRYDTV